MNQNSTTMKSTPSKNITLETVEDDFRDFIIGKNHPCVMANTVFRMNTFHIKAYDTIESDEVIDPVLADIQNYLENYDFESNMFESLIICFKNDQFRSEIEFEKALWNFLQKLHNKDNVAWDPTVSQDPNDSNFSLSIKGRAFYIIGMHPESSRLARQAPYCTVVFNLHMQFDKLREMGTYQSVKKRIRSRDKALQGTINPVLQDFGDDSETKQYSGRNVESTWKCPFHQKQNNN